MAASDFLGTVMALKGDTGQRVRDGDLIVMSAIEGEPTRRNVQLRRNGQVESSGTGDVVITPRAAQLRAELSTFDLMLTVRSDFRYQINTFGGGGDPGCCGVTDPPGNGG